MNDIHYNYVRYVNWLSFNDVEICHSSKRRKLSADTYQEIYQDIINGRTVDLDDFDIDDSDRKIPPRIYDIDGTYVNGYTIHEILVD
jgi:hypothetical protein